LKIAVECCEETLVAVHFTPAFEPSKEETTPAWWFAYCGERLLVKTTDGGATVPKVENLEALNLKPVRTFYVGAVDGQSCYAAECDGAASAPEGMAFEWLRQLVGWIDDALFWAAGCAKLIIQWDRTHRFCGQCGRPTVDKAEERAKLCAECGLVVFPRLSPAVIVAVTHGDRILLARSPRFPEGRYSVLAGFVEPGESLEECVQREVREEVGLELADIRYFGSQPWPFPNSLMIGFTADYASGQMRIDRKEIVEADWFSADHLPRIPPKLTIARQLIDGFMKKHAPK
jgi:NAD+ diphosphatase